MFPEIAQPQPAVQPGKRYQGASGSSSDLYRETGSSSSQSQQPSISTPVTPQPAVQTVAPPVYAIVQTPMPLPGTVGAPSFEGNNITGFLETWELLVRDHHLTEGDSVYRLPSYCSPMIKEAIRSLPEAQERNFSAFKRRLLREYIQHNESQKVFSKAFLEEYKNAARERKVELTQYCRQFRSIASKLMAKGILVEYEGTEWFLQRLNDRTFRKVCKDCRIDPLEPESFKLMTTIDKAVALSTESERFKTLRKADVQSEELKKLVDVRLKDPTKQQEPYGTLSEMFSLKEKKASKEAVPIVAKEDPAIDAITKAFGQMALPLEARITSLQQQLA